MYNHAIPQPIRPLSMGQLMTNLGMPNHPLARAEIPTYKVGNQKFIDIEKWNSDFVRSYIALGRAKRDLERRTKEDEE